MHALFFKTLPLCLLATACSPKAQPSPSKPPTTRHAFALEHLVPNEALFAISTTDFQTIRELATQNTWTRLFAEETLWDMHAALVSASEWSGFREADPLRALQQVQGAAVWFMSMADDGRGGSMGLVVEPKNTDPEIADLWIWLEDRMRIGGETSTHEIEGVSVRFQESRNGAAFFVTPELQGMAFAEPAEEALAVVRGILQRAAGDKTTRMTETDAFRDFAGQRMRGAIASVYMPLGADMGRRMQAAPKSLASLYDALSLPDIPWIGADLVLGRGEYWQLSARAPIPKDSLLDAVLSHQRPLPLDLLEDLPAENFAVLLADANWLGGLESVQSELETRWPIVARAFQQGLEQFARETQVDLKADVLASLQGPVAMSLIPVPWRLPDFSRSRNFALDVWFMEQSPLWIAPIHSAAPVHSAMARIKQSLRTESSGTVKIGEHQVYPLAKAYGVLHPHYAVVETGQKPLLVALQLSTMMRTLRRIDRNDTLDRGDVRALSAALAEHKRAFLALGIESASLASLLVGALRPMGQSMGEGWEEVRWPANYSIFKRLHGHTVGSLRYTDRILNFTLEAR